MRISLAKILFCIAKTSNMNWLPGILGDWMGMSATH